MKNAETLEFLHDLAKRIEGMIGEAHDVADRLREVGRGDIKISLMGTVLHEERSRIAIDITGQRDELIRAIGRAKAAAEVLQQHVDDTINDSGQGRLF